MANQKPNKYDMFSDSHENNSMMTALAGRLIEARNKSIQNILSDFEGSEHKLEYVKTINGIDFVNDSRSINSNAVWYALESMTKPTTWIMNINNQEDLTEALLDSIYNKVNSIVIQGVYNSKILDFFSGLNKKVYFSMNLEDAVRTAFYSSEPGDVILFSPGISSVGIYPTYRERGNKFKDAVAQL